MSENCAIDFEYNPQTQRISGGDSLTAALFQFLQHNGVDVMKSGAPVIMYEDQAISMTSRLLRIDVPMEQNFQEVLDYVRDYDKVFLYMVVHKYTFGQFYDHDQEPVGEPRLSECRTVRLGVI
jgi:hypothetical protein